MPKQNNCPVARSHFSRLPQNIVIGPVSTTIGETVMGSMGARGGDSLKIGWGSMPGLETPGSDGVGERSTVHPRGIHNLMSARQTPLRPPMINTTICAHKIEDLEGAPDSNLWMDSTHNSRNLVHGPRGVCVCVCACIRFRGTKTWWTPSSSRAWVAGPAAGPAQSWSSINRFGCQHTFK